MDEGKSGESERPEIGRWYRDREDRLFEVVARDAEDATIEIQHFDGTVEELDVTGWLSRSPQRAAPPEDWSGSMDISARDYRADYGGDTGPDWEDPLDRIDRLD